MSDEQQTRKTAAERARGLAEERARRRAAKRKGYLSDQAIDRVLEAIRKAGGKVLSKFAHHTFPDGANSDIAHQAKVDLKFAISIAFTSRNVVERKSELSDQAWIGEVLSATRKIISHRHPLAIFPGQEAPFAQLMRLQDFVSTIVSAQEKGNTLASAVDAAMAKIVPDSPPRIDWGRLSSTAGDAFMDGLAGAYWAATHTKATTGKVSGRPFIAFVQAILKETQHPPMTASAIRKALQRARGQKF